MNKERYICLIHWAEEKEARKRILCFLSKVLPVVLAVDLSALSAYLFFCLSCVTFTPGTSTSALLFDSNCFKKAA